MKKIFSAAIALLIMSSVSFAQDAKQAPQTATKMSTKQAPRSSTTLKANKMPVSSSKMNTKKAATATK